MSVSSPSAAPRGLAAVVVRELERALLQARSLQRDLEQIRQAYEESLEESRRLAENGLASRNS